MESPALVYVSFFRFYPAERAEANARDRSADGHRADGLQRVHAAGCGCRAVVLHEAEHRVIDAVSGARGTIAVRRKTVVGRRIFRATISQTTVMTTVAKK